jgi:16S rRNA (uracil1498-N3)-methyltransferase
MIQLFIRSEQISGFSVRLDPRDYHYLSRVLRVSAKDQVTLVVDQSEALLVRPERFSDGEMVYVLIETHSATFPQRPQVTLIQCLPKQDKFSDILRKCTEMGVDAFCPVENSRSVTRLRGDAAEKKRIRWEKVIESAAQQSQQSRMPSISLPQSFKTFVENFDGSDYDLKLVAWEEEKKVSLRSVLRGKTQEWGGSLARSVAVFVGPEGGISEEERGALVDRGFVSISLGSTILRVENAGLVVCSNVFYELDEEL